MDSCSEILSPLASLCSRKCGGDSNMLLSVVHSFSLLYRIALYEHAATHPLDHWWTCGSCPDFDIMTVTHCYVSVSACGRSFSRAWTWSGTARSRTGYIFNFARWVVVQELLSLHFLTGTFCDPLSFIHLPSFIHLILCHLYPSSVFS